MWTHKDVLTAPVWMIRNYMCNWGISKCDTDLWFMSIMSKTILLTHNVTITEWLTQWQSTLSIKCKYVVIFRTHELLDSTMIDGTEVNIFYSSNTRNRIGNTFWQHCKHPLPRCRYMNICCKCFRDTSKIIQGKLKTRTVLHKRQLS